MKKIAGIIAVAFLLVACAFLAAVALSQPPAPWTMPISPYGPEDFRQTEQFLACDTGAVAVGIDVSSHQGQIDWQQVASAGVKYAFVRIGYRGYGNGAMALDTKAADNLRGAKDAGLLVGAYFFSQAIDVAEAEEEASFAVENLKNIGVTLDLPLVYDWEYVSETARTAQMDRQTLTACTLAFCRAVAAEGYDPMIYFNTSQGRDLLDLEKLERYPWWLAKYDLSAEFLCRVDLWQYTNQGAVPGITVPVDINLMFLDYGLGKAVFGPAE